MRKKSEAEYLENQWTASRMETDREKLDAYLDYQVDPDRHVATITFKRPEALNAIPVAGLELVGDYIKEAEADDRVKVIVFKGEGPCFGTGADGNELGFYIGYGAGEDKASKRRPAQRQRMLPDRNMVFGAFTTRVAECLKATICQVHGYCYGGHMQIALAADIVIASEDATFTHPAFRYLGAGPQDMVMWIENLGVKKAKEIMLTMRPLDADEAEACGFVNRVTSADELQKWTDDYVDAIAMMPLDGIMIGKSMMQLALNARGAKVGEMGAWIAHGWATNLGLQDGEWNFLKERRDKGLKKALAERDAAVAPFFRMGGRGKSGSGK